MGQAPVWVAVLGRVLAVLATAGPAVQKVADYPGQVAFFTSLGIPLPGVMVIISAVVELVAIVMIALGLAGRLAALALLGNMLVAIVTAGFNPLSGAALLGALLVVLVGTGPRSLWQPEAAWLARLRRQP